MRFTTKKTAILLASLITLGSASHVAAETQWHMPTPYGDANLPIWMANTDKLKLFKM